MKPLENDLTLEKSVLIAYKNSATKLSHAVVASRLTPGFGRFLAPGLISKKSDTS